MTTDNTQQIMNELKVNKLPSLPHVLVEMLEACQEDGATFQRMSQIISHDAAITARVISLANSSFYNRGTEIKSIERALLVLGTDTIKTIVITAAVQQFFSGFKSQHLVFLKQFWKHSLSTALIAKALAILTSYPNPDEAYLTALLHNIGEVVLDSHFPQEYAELRSKPEVLTHKLCKFEQEAFSVDHTQIGAWLAKEWNLSSFAVDAIEFHHAEPESIQDAHHLVKLIYLSSQLGTFQQDYFSGDSFADLGYQLFELNSALLKEIVFKVEGDVKEMAKTLNIEIDIQADIDSENDKKAQVKLAEQVRKIGLIQNVSTELSHAQNRDELGRSLRTSLELLFGFSQSEVYWFNPESKELVSGQAHGDNEVPIKVKLSNERSLVAQSAARNQVMCSLDHNIEASSSANDSNNLSVVDQQITRGLNSTGIVCCPIRTHEDLFCVLVIACEHSLSQSSHQIRLLKYFTEEMAQACSKTTEKITRIESDASTEAMAQRAREIAHEANNPLNIINNYLVSLSNKLTGPAESYEQHELAEELDIVREELNRTSQIILRLRDLKQEAVETQSGVDINTEIKHLCTLYEHSLFVLHDTSYQLDLDQDLKRIGTKRNQFKQIITNLIKNASEAMPEGGIIFISTAANINLNGQGYVEILIKDQGPGLPEEIAKSLFKPVTSTKGDGHSGLGLSITKNLVRDAKGTISCRSNEKGTTFQIFLPQESL
jgi:HD-like signal output (HDOD) protein/signal transduction histidine kinase